MLNYYDLWRCCIDFETHIQLETLSNKQKRKFQQHQTGCDCFLLSWAKQSETNIQTKPKKNSEKKAKQNKTG